VHDTGTVTTFPAQNAIRQIECAKALAFERQLVEFSVGQRNERIDCANKRIDYVMQSIAGTTADARTSDSDDDGVIPNSADATPKSNASTADKWWQWWANYNEAYMPAKSVATIKFAESAYYKHDIDTSTSCVTSGLQVYNSATHELLQTHSCFAAGTTVVTQIGPVAIEKLKIGDRVLAQDADSGELNFKPVLGTTVRPPVEMALVTTARGELKTTRGHPFWIVGKGWRMAKELQVGERVVSLGGTATVTALAKQAPEPAYNLIVADFGTYFVGEGRILVHDNTPRLPTPVAIPGYIADDGWLSENHN
jgi:hypothetical protein